MAFDLGAVIAHIKADVSGFQDGIKKVKQGTEDLEKTTNSTTDKLVGLAKKAAAAFVAFQVGSKIASFLGEASEAASELEKAMITLDIIAGRFGESGQKAQESAKNLGRELLIGVGPAANGLQNLLKSGLNLDQANDLLKRFTNEALTGKSSSIGLGQAVENLSFAYATNNSAIGNLSGINENFQDIIEKGRESLIKKGVAVNTITDDMAKYEGIINLTNLTEGSAERLSDSLATKQAVLGQKFQDLKVAVGDLVNPAIGGFIDLILNSGLIEGLTAFTQGLSSGGEFLKSVGIDTTALQAIWTEFKSFLNETLRPAIQVFIDWFKAHWTELTQLFKGAWQIMFGIVQFYWGVIYGLIKIGLELLAGDWQGAFEALV